MTRATAGPAVLTRLAADALRVLYQHRLLSTGQLHRLLTPAAADSSYLRAELGRLRHTGLAAATRRATPPHDNLWFATDTGADAVESTGELPVRGYRTNARRADGALQQHTLAVNDTGIAFVHAARRFGHHCGPLDWTPEVAHRLRAGRATNPGDLLIVDAVLHYATDDGHHRDHHTVFLEVDRATMTVARLADKLTRYARYHAHTPRAGDRPSWQWRYPRFPRILFVLTGAAPDTLARRITDLRAHTTAMPHLHRLRDETTNAGATTLDDLVTHGPLAPIVTSLLDDVAPRPVLSWV